MDQRPSPRPLTVWRPRCPAADSGRRAEHPGPRMAPAHRAICTEDLEARALPSAPRRRPRLKSAGCSQLVRTSHGTRLARTRARRPRGLHACRGSAAAARVTSTTLLPCTSSWPRLLRRRSCRGALRPPRSPRSSTVYSSSTSRNTRLQCLSNATSVPVRGVGFDIRGAARAGARGGVARPKCRGPQAATRTPTRQPLTCAAAPDALSVARDDEDAGLLGKGLLQQHQWARLDRGSDRLQRTDPGPAVARRRWWRGRTAWLARRVALRGARGPLDAALCAHLPWHPESPRVAPSRPPQPGRRTSWRAGRAGAGTRVCSRAPGRRCGPGRASVGSTVPTVSHVHCRAPRAHIAPRVNSARISYSGWDVVRMGGGELPPEGVQVIRRPRRGYGRQACRGLERLQRIEKGG